MKFNYNEDVSRILDYLAFPSIYFFNKSYKDSSDDLLIKAIDESYIDFTESMQNKLKKWEGEIKEIFHEDMYSHNDFHTILIKAFPVYEYKSEHQYLDDLLGVDELTFKEKMMKALVALEEDKGDVEDVFVDDMQAMQYINNLKVDSAHKWNLLMMFQKPKEQLEKYIQLLNHCESIFINHYQKMKKKVHEVGTYLAKEFSSDTVESFKKITYHSINYDFDKSEVGHIYVSAIFPYALRILENEEVRLIWGLDMEKSFRIVHEINEDELSHRVKAFKALGDKTRYESLKLLSQGVTSIKQIAEALDVSSATISYHINEFLTSGILKINRGKEKKSSYIIDYDALNKIIEDFREDLGFKK